ncbi:MAG: hypothetical protein AAGF12_27170 [Myxococcota bacterium]
MSPDSDNQGDEPDWEKEEREIQEILEDVLPHAEDHRREGELPFDSEDELRDELERIIREIDPIERDRGRREWRDEETGIVVIHEPNETGGTAFIPDNADYEVDK